MGQLIEFPDVSFYQGVINWVKMKTKVDNVIIRSSQGNWVDSQFVNNWPGAKANNIMRGAYHFFDDRYSPDVQVQTIVNLIKQDLPEKRVWIDWEDLSYHDAGNYKGLGNVVAVMKGVEQALHVPVGMYTGYYWFRDHSNSSANSAEYDYLKSKPLWIAAYTADGSSGNLFIPQPWTYPPELHQYGTPAIGGDYGVQSEEIDMNRVLSNHSYYTISTTPIPPEPPTGGSFMLGEVVVSALNVRRQPNSDNNTNAPVAQLKLGDIVEADTEVNGWWHITKATRAGVVLALPIGDLYAYEGATNNYIKDITPPPSEPTPPQEIIVKDENGVAWRSTVFTKV